MKPFSQQILDYVPTHPGKDEVEGYAGDQMVIFKPKILFVGEFYLPFFQFVMPILEMPLLTVEKKLFILGLIKCCLLMRNRAIA